MSIATTHNMTHLVRDTEEPYATLTRQHFLPIADAMYYLNVSETDAASRRVKQFTDVHRLFELPASRECVERAERKVEDMFKCV
jgi:hypothetical protein